MDKRAVTDFALGTVVDVTAGVFSGHHGTYVQGRMDKHPLRYGILCDIPESIAWCSKEQLALRGNTK